MKKTIVKSMIIVALLFCMSHLQAQYKVFNTKGVVEMSRDGKSWEPLKKKAELKKSDQIRVHENSLVDIIDSQNLIYSYKESKTLSVGEIIKKRKSILEVINEESGKRKAIGGVEKGIEDENPYRDVCLFYTDTESLDIYDNFELVPEGAVFYLTIYNPTKEDKTVNVSQKLENGELIPCFPKGIKVEKNTSAEIKELLFAKQTNNNFVIVCKRNLQ